MKIKQTDTHGFNLEDLSFDDLSMIIASMRHCAIDTHGALPAKAPLAAAFQRLSQAVSELRKENFDENQK